MSKLVTLILLSLLFSGCSSTDEVEIPKHIKELDSLTVYSADTEPVYSIKFEREQTFGNTDEVFIRNIAGLAIDESGRVFIAEGTRGRSSIHVFNPDGSYLTTLGGFGRGPGEFLNIYGMRIGSNRLFAYDTEQFRITVFSLASLTVDRVVNLQLESWRSIEELNEAGPNPYNIFPMPNNLFLVGFGNPPRYDETEQKRYLRYYLVGRDGRILPDRVFKQRDFKYLTGTFRGNQVAFTEPFMRNSLIAVSNDGRIFSAWSEEFLIKVHAPKGEYLYAFYYPYEKRPLNRDVIINRFDEAWQDRQDMLREYKRRYQNVEFPETWPALHSMLVDDENRLWISTITDNEELYEWWVVDQYGQLLAQFTWPGKQLNRLIGVPEIKEIKDGRFYNLERDEESGLQRIVRYRIEMN